VIFPFLLCVSLGIATAYLLRVMPLDALGQQIGFAIRVTGASVVAALAMMEVIRFQGRTATIARRAAPSNESSDQVAAESILYGTESPARQLPHDDKSGLLRCMECGATGKYQWAGLPRDGMGWGECCGKQMQLYLPVDSWDFSPRRRSTQ